MGRIRDLRMYDQRKRASSARRQDDLIRAGSHRKILNHVARSRDDVEDGWTLGVKISELYGVTFGALLECQGHFGDLAYVG
jgi:hypothetical protein